MTKEIKQKIIGEFIKHARVEKNFTQQRVSNDTGLSRNYISDVENGRYMPSVETLLLLTSYLKIDLNVMSKMTEIQVGN